MKPFTPFTGFIPEDGDDPRVSLSRDNPCRPSNRNITNNRSRDLSKAGDGAGLDHGTLDTQFRERNNG
jgi:hypothetical protein